MCHCKLRGVRTKFVSAPRVWDRFYNWRAIWDGSACTPKFSARIAFIVLSKLHRQMYAGAGISTDSARRKKSKAWARWTARQCGTIPGQTNAGVAVAGRGDWAATPLDRPRLRVARCRRRQGPPLPEG